MPVRPPVQFEPQGARRTLAPSLIVVPALMHLQSATLVDASGRVVDGHDEQAPIEIMSILSL